MARFGWFGVAGALALFRKRSEAACSDAREVCAHVQEHLTALAELFSLELSHYLRVQTIRTLLYLAAGFVLCVAYLVFWAFVITLLSSLTGWVWATAISCALNLLAAFILFRAAGAIKPGAVAPDTLKEVKNDLQCLRLLLQNKQEKTGF